MATYVQYFPDEVIANGGYEEVKGPPKTVDADEAPKDQEPSADKVLTSTVDGEDLHTTSKSKTVKGNLNPMRSYSSQMLHLCRLTRYVFYWAVCILEYFTN